MTTTTATDLSTFFNPRRELLTLACGALEICWIYGFFAVTFQATGFGARGVSVWVFVALVMIAMYSTRLLQNSVLSLKNQQLLTAVLALSAILLAMRLTIFADLGLGDFSWLGAALSGVLRLFMRISAEALFVMMGLVAWWRGMTMAQMSLDFDSIGFRFRLGVLLLALLTLINTWIGRVALTPYLFAFFFFGLIAVALARQEDVGRGEAHISLPLKGPWLGILFGSALLVLGVGIALATIMTPRSLLVILSWFRPLMPLVVLILYALVWLLSIIVEMAYRIILFVMLLVRGNNPNDVNQQPPALPPPLVLPQNIEAFTIPEPIQMACAVLLFIGVILLLALSLSRLRRREREDSQVTREGVPLSVEWDPLGKLRAWFNRPKPLALDERVASIRRIYANLVRLSANRGFPRGEAETPYEFMRDLHAAFPGADADEREITEAYVRVHYGEQEPSQAEVAAVKEAWERIKQVKSEEG